MLGCENDLLQLLNPQVAKFVGLTFFAVVLDADDAFCIGGIFDVSGNDAVDFDADFFAFATDAVGIPVVTFEGIAGALAEGGFAFFIAFNGAGKPHATTFIVETTGPFSVRVAIDFCLVAEDFVLGCMSTEHEAAVGLSGGEKNFALENEIAVGFFGNEKELLGAGEVDLITYDFGLAPGVGIFPAIESFSIEEWLEIRFVLGKAGASHEACGGQQG